MFTYEMITGFRFVAIRTLTVCDLHCCDYHPGNRGWNSWLCLPERNCKFDGSPCVCVCVLHLLIHTHTLTHTHTQTDITGGRAREGLNEYREEGGDGFQSDVNSAIDYIQIEVRRA